MAGLDAQLGGGVPPGSVHLLLGEPMNALELFTYHFAASSPKSGIKSQFVTTSGTEEQVRDGIKAIGGDPGKATVTSLANAKQWTLPNPTVGYRYVLDSFSEFALHVGWDKAYERLVELREKVREGTGNLLVTAIPDLHNARAVGRRRARPGLRPPGIRPLSVPEGHEDARRAGLGPVPPVQGDGTRSLHGKHAPRLLRRGYPLSDPWRCHEGAPPAVQPPAS